MVLTIHIDNREISLGVYEGGNQQASSSIGTDLCGTSDQYAAAMQGVLAFHGIQTAYLDGAALSSVVPALTHTLKKAAQRLCGKTPLVVEAGIKTGLNLRLDNLGTVGSDFICNAAAALKRFQPPFVLIQLAGATTFTAIDASGALIGRSILPGVESSLEHLCKSSAQLPDVSFDPKAMLLGRGTGDAIRSGILYGTISMLEGMLARYRGVLGEQAKAIVTGGSLAKTVCRCWSEEAVYQSHLLHQGLYLLYLKNQK